MSGLVIFRVELLEGRIHLKHEGGQWQSVDVLVRHDIGVVWVSDLLTVKERARAVDAELRAMGYVPMVPTD